MRQILKRIICVVLLIAISLPILTSVINAAENTESITPRAVNPALFSVTVPTSLPVEIDGYGNAIAATSAKIINNSRKSVMVTNVEIVGVNGWTICDYINTDFRNERVDSNQIGIVINNCKTTNNGIDFLYSEFNIMEAMNDTSSDECSISYHVKATPCANGFNGTAANVVFTIDGTAFAFFSADDNSLNFVRTDKPLHIGDTVNGKTISKLYNGIESTDYFLDHTATTLNAYTNVPWILDATYAQVQKVIVSDEIAPVSMAGWFALMENCSSIDIQKIDTSDVTNMRDLFDGCKILKTVDISHFVTDKVTTMRSMFTNCFALESVNLSSFNTSNVTDMCQMFANCNSLTSLDITNFNMTNVENIDSMFHECFALAELDLSNWTTMKATDANELFTDCTSLKTIDISNWNTSNIKVMDLMFANCEALTTVYVSDVWSTASVGSSTEMFAGCESIVGGSGTTYNGRYIDKTYARIDQGWRGRGYFTQK